MIIFLFNTFDDDWWKQNNIAIFFVITFIQATKVFSVVNANSLCVTKSRVPNKNRFVFHNPKKLISNSPYHCIYLQFAMHISYYICKTAVYNFHYDSRYLFSVARGPKIKKKKNIVNDKTCKCNKWNESLINTCLS